MRISLALRPLRFFQSRQNPSDTSARRIRRPCTVSPAPGKARSRRQCLPGRNHGHPRPLLPHEEGPEGDPPCRSQGVAESSPEFPSLDRLRYSASSWLSPQRIRRVFHTCLSKNPLFLHLMPQEYWTRPDERRLPPEQLHQRSGG